MAGVVNLLRSIINALEKTERALAIDVLNRQIVNMMLVYSELVAIKGWTWRIREFIAKPT